MQVLELRLCEDSAPLYCGDINSGDLFSEKFNDEWALDNLLRCTDEWEVEGHSFELAAFYMIHKYVDSVFSRLLAGAKMNPQSFVIDDRWVCAVLKQAPTAHAWINPAAVVP